MSLWDKLLGNNRTYDVQKAKAADDQLRATQQVARKQVLSRQITPTQARQNVLNAAPSVQQPRLKTRNPMLDSNILADSLKTAKYGVLANNPQAQTNLMKSVSTPNKFKQAASNIGAGVKAAGKFAVELPVGIAGAAINTAQVPYSAARVAAAQATRNQPALANAKKAWSSDMSNNFYYNDTFKQVSDIAAGAISGKRNLNKNIQANQNVANTLTNAYGNTPQAKMYFDTQKSMQDNQDANGFLRGYGIDQNTSRLATAGKVGLPVVNAGAQIALTASGIGAGARIANQAAIQGAKSGEKVLTRELINTLGKQGNKMGLTMGGLNTIGAVSQGASPLEVLTAAGKGYGGGFVLPFAGAATAPIKQEAFNTAKKTGGSVLKTLDNNLALDKLSGRLMSIEEGKTQNLKLREEASKRGETKTVASLDKQFKGLVGEETRLKIQEKIQKKSIGLGTSKVGDESAKRPISPEYDRSGKPVVSESSKIVSSKNTIDPLESLKQEARKYTPLQEDLAFPGSYTPAKLPQVINDNNLFAKYPDLKDVTVKYHRPGDKASGLTGLYDVKTKTISLPSDVSDSQKISSLIHEIQHAKQDIQGRIVQTKSKQDGFHEYANHPLEVEARNKSQQLTDLYNQSQPSPLVQKPSIPKNEVKTPRVANVDPMQAIHDKNPLKSQMDSGDYVKDPQGRIVQIGEVLKRSPLSKTPEGSIPIRKSSSSANTTPLPELNTKLATGVDRAFRSNRSVIERQGTKGQELAGLLQKSRDVEEIYQAKILKELPTVKSLKGKDFENFVDATQGLDKAKSPKIEQAVKEWQSVHPEIRNRAVAAGLEVGDLGASYYPHFIDYEKIYKDKNTYNAAINHLVDSGQAPSVEKAIELLTYARDVSRNRKFGNLESQRLIDLPMYDKTPNSLISYLQGSSRRIAQTETFGKGDEKAMALVKGIAENGYDAEAAKNAYDISVGAKQYNPNTSKISGNVRKYLSTTRLGLGAITNSSQNVNTGIVTGHIRTLGAMVKQLDPKTRSFVEDTGTVADSVINDIKEGTGFTGKVLSKITAPGFGKVEKFNRSVAATAGRDYAMSLAKKGDVKTLKKLGVTGNIGKTLTEAQQIQAARKVVEKTQFKVDAQDLPGWADSPGGKLVSQFRTFSYNQSKFFSNEIAKPLAKGNVMPLARLLAALPIGYALYETKAALNKRETDDPNWRKGVEAFGNVGGAGLAVDIFKSLVPLNNKTVTPERRVSMAVGAFGGPAAGSAAELVGAVSNAAPKALSGTGDATQLGRLGLRQVPIAGTRLQNTFLPYGKKKETSPSTKLKNEKEDLTKAGFTTPEAKKFAELSEEDKKFYQNEPEYAGLYKQWKAAKQAFSLTDTHPQLPADEKKAIESWNRLTKSGKSNVYGLRPTDKLAYEYSKAHNDLLNGDITQAQFDKKFAKAQPRSKRVASGGRRGRKSASRKFTPTSLLGIAGKKSINLVAKAPSIKKATMTKGRFKKTA